ncbi:hypothetical protein ACQV2L_23285, partial [Pantoea allii]|uniref:hypothetical protein n=1 Tax=Pantoea allii TaxID=574096 RepID=UPI003D32112C
IPASGSRRCPFVTHCGLTDRPDAPSLPRRPGLRSLLSAPDASSKSSPVRTCSLFGAALPEDLY